MTKSSVVSVALAGMIVVSGGVARVASAEDSEAHASRAQAVSAIATMERSSDRVRTLLRLARQMSPERTISCLNEGLSQVDVSVRSARERNQSMTQAFARGDTVIARRDLAQIAWQKLHVHELVTSSETCLDPRFLPAKEGTTVTVLIDPTLRPEPNVFSR